MSDAEVDEVEAWIGAYKTFDHYFPEWVESKGRCDWQTSWPIVDMHGVASAIAYFEANASFSEISISIVFRRAPVYRLDKINESEPEGNSLDAQKYAPHVPAQFFGSHVHGWEDNREWVRAKGAGEVPFKHPITAPSTLELMLQHAATEVNITVPASFRDIGLPPQSGLNLKWGPRK